MSASGILPKKGIRCRFTLARYAGLRIPSELFALRWADVDFDAGTMKVRSPKTEHHEGGAWRMVPLFKELRPHLDALFGESAAEGTVFVISKHRLPGMNLRTEFGRILERADVPEWPKLFHNLRASRESELMREYDLATVCRWIGNSPAVAAKHYATSIDLDADFKKAAGLGEAQQNAQQSAHASTRHDKTADRPENKNRPENPSDGECCPMVSTAGKSKDWAIQDRNTPEVSTEKSNVSSEGAVKGAANPEDSDFAAMIRAILSLPLTETEKAQAIRRLLSGN